MKYSQKTQKLIDRMCHNIERKDFELDKEKAEECLVKTYDLFHLERPKKIVWCVDIFDEQFAGSAWSAGSALDYDFDYFIFEHEYCNNRKDNPGNEPNKNDYTYLEYCELLMQAKEAGMGYRVEFEGTVYCVPTPIVRVDEHSKFHSISESAIRWKGGKEFYYVHGVYFTHTLWKSIVDRTIRTKDVLALDNIEQRMVTLKVIGVEQLLHETHATLLDTSKRGNELYKVEHIFNQTAYFLKYTDPSTNRVYVSGIPPALGELGEADSAMAWKFQLTPEEYTQLTQET